VPDSEDEKEEQKETINAAIGKRKDRNSKKTVSFAMH